MKNLEGYVLSCEIKEVKTEAEIQRLADMAGKIWHEFFPGIISKEQIDYMVDKFQSFRAMTDQMQNQGYRYHVLEADGEPMGYTGWKLEDGKLFLSKIYLKKEARGKGYSSILFRFLEQQARENNASAIWLTVNKYNAHSIAVYEHKGFKTVRTQEADIGNGFIMDDYIMEKAM